jgi:hypothetical protein
MSAFPNATSVYTLIGLNNLGCATIYTITQLVDACTGLTTTKNSAANLFVYPNPNNGSFVMSADFENQPFYL